MSRRPGLVLALLAFAQLIISLDYNIVYVALPEIGHALGFGTQSLQWVVSAYAVTFGGFLLLGGRASDLFGPRRMFSLGLGLYCGASLAGGLAAGPGLLVAARAGQGLGGALLFPATLTLVSTSFAEGRARNRAFAVWGTAGGSGMILGSLLGGLLTQLYGWAAVFFVNVPLAAVAALLAFPLLAADPPREPGRRFDLGGAVTATLGMTSVVFALVEGPELGWTSPVVLVAAAAGAALLVTFAVLEGRGRDPLLPLRLLRERNLGTGVVVTFLYMGTLRHQAGAGGRPGRGRDRHGCAGVGDERRRVLRGPGARAGRARTRPGRRIHPDVRCRGGRCRGAGAGGRRRCGLDRPADRRRGGLVRGGGQRRYAGPVRRGAATGHCGRATDGGLPGRGRDRRHRAHRTRLHRLPVPRRQRPAEESAYATR
ncbi:MFS transporter [Amycolatopsis cynarae]|uniref:MFS transporter n=1 Tax=Amycolatopsis cynarae TaxID=2995223 RepID=A0ABY7AWJ0_9PSEU|nr:MFS transporter [Amycolatopsis sp. HUAS 11-8]WAL64369.1 MFS transporter [Amycolatopsis sp. HUAS 11-8]